MNVVLLVDKNRGGSCLSALFDSSHDVVGAITPPESDTGDWYESPAEIASGQGIPVLRPVDVNDPATVEWIANRNPDVLAMAGYSQILESEVLTLAPNGVVNLHGGRLPEYRGASTLNWMIINGETRGGMAVLFADEGIDTGDLIAQETFEIGIDHTIADVVEIVDARFPDMLVEALDRIEDGTVEPSPQRPTEGSYYHSRRPRDGEIHWREQTAKEVYDLVRALVKPYPGAFTWYEGKRLIVWQASLLEEEVRGVPGRVARRHEDGVVVIAADRGLLIETVQYGDGPEQDAVTFFDNVGVDLGR